MASVKRIKVTVEVDINQVSPRNVLSDDDIRKNMKAGLQEFFNWGVTQNSDVILKEYFCEVTTISGDVEQI